MDIPLPTDGDAIAAAAAVSRPARGAIHEHHLTVTRTARYVTLGPTGDGAVRELWIVCHGHGQLAARFIRHFASLDDGTRLIVAPEALSRYYLDPPSSSLSAADRRVGATWMTREDRLSEINDQVSYLDALHTHLVRHLDRDALRLHVLGFSQGAATVCRWLAASQVRPDDVTLWAGSVPPDLDLATGADSLRRARFTLVAGDRDEFATAEVLRQQELRLREAGIRFRFLSFDGGHHLDAATLARLAAAQAAD